MLLYVSHHACVNQEKIYIFGKSSFSWNEIILQSLDVDLNCNANYRELFFYKRTCYKHLTKFERVTFEVKEIKREIEGVIRARDPVTTKRMIRYED